MPMMLSQNDRVHQQYGGRRHSLHLDCNSLNMHLYGSCFFKSGLISPADAQSLGPSIGSTYYTPNMPFAVLKEVVTNGIPTLLATSTGGRKLQNFDELNDLLSSITVILPQIEPFSVGVSVARITGSRRALAASLHLQTVALQCETYDPDDIAESNLFSSTVV